MSADHWVGQGNGIHEQRKSGEEMETGTGGSRQIRMPALELSRVLKYLQGIGWDVYVCAGKRYMLVG
jgi:hypothetical protein